MIIDASKVMCKTMTSKIEPTNNSKSHTYFTKYLIYVTEKPPLEENEH
jgi:hypothetical protein